MNLTLHASDFAALSPQLILIIAAAVVLLIESFAKGNAAKLWASIVTILAFALGIAVSYHAPVSHNELLTPWIHFDSLSHFFNIFFFSIGLAVALLASPFFQRFAPTAGEFLFLLLTAVFGLTLIGSSADFLTLFLGIETLSISLYILCGYMKKWTFSSEAAIKYFLMGSLAAGFLLYAIALIYGAIGTTRFDALLTGYKGLHDTQGQALFLGGIALVTLSLCFEATIVPFQLWAPDVYDGASTPVTAFMTVGTKVGAFAAFIRVFLMSLPNFNIEWNEAIAFLAWPTLIYSNYLAMRQTQLRRFFAYSGISHAGYMLLPLAAQVPDSLNALLYYLIVYAFATLGCFAVIAFLDERKEGVNLNDFSGLFRRSPWLAGIMAVCLLTLAGIPPTAGFFAKFYLFKVAFQAGYYGLVILGLAVAILSAYYYLRIIGYMLTDKTEEAPTPNYTWGAGIVGAVAFAAILYLSAYPAPVLNLLAAVG